MSLCTMALAVTQKDFHCDVNNSAHHTNRFSKDRLIVRRGQDFLLSVSFNREFPQGADTLQLTVETGPKASDSAGTRSAFGVPSVVKSKSWGATIQKTSQNTVTLKITSPPDASIGKYSLSLQTGTTPVQNHTIGNLIVLFNPWCSEDWVYLPKEDERQEYVMNDSGRVFRGTRDYIHGIPWTFGQFEEDVLEICLWMLNASPKFKRDPGEDCSARCNPIYVSRIVSAMINSNDDNGVLVGKWDDDYKDGVKPTSWSDSVSILRKWHKSGGQPVKYGQCWVFAAVMCTVMRCLGIPTRVVSNFDSAHDSDGNLTIDMYRGNAKKQNESVWNFHVWVESWMRRPDLQGDFGGWQVLDPTPQERSEGAFCCGPAPVKAILEGHTEHKYDVPFVFAEVNADIVVWYVESDGTKTKMSTDTQSVGKNISTKAVGSDARTDITSSYKYPEGSAKEREVYTLAVSKGHVTGGVRPPTAPEQPEITLKIEEQSAPVRGQDISLRLIVHSNSTVTRKMTVNINADSICYNGVCAEDFWSENRDVEVQPQTEITIPILIPYSKYEGHVLENKIMRVEALTHLPWNNRGFFTSKNMFLSRPTLSLKTTGPPVLFGEMVAELVVENMTAETLKDCTVTLTGPGLLKCPQETGVPALGPNRRLRVQIPFEPFEAGQRVLMADFNCSLFQDVRGCSTVHVQH
ncbi:protein-glutamine gamma-glutamyltransferase 5-like [Lepisosteus oculatus]|uniref:protein-glutamine gamma-glutamyltransferase 5-like n=1 Tax=Lepisosteus oculatus TaxID=7918 RepID=UPI0035F52D0B